MLLIDGFGSSEAVGMGASISSGGCGGEDGEIHARAQRRGAHRGRPRASSRAPASAACWLAVPAAPLGYYKDEEKTRRTFRMFEGRR